jgi:hypothetical protein
MHDFVRARLICGDGGKIKPNVGAVVRTTGAMALMRCIREEGREEDESMKGEEGGGRREDGNCTV